MSQYISKVKNGYEKTFFVTGLFGAAPVLAACEAILKEKNPMNEHEKANTGHKFGYGIGAVLLTPITAVLALAFATLTAISAPFVFAVAAIMDSCNKKENATLSFDLKFNVGKF